MKWRFPDIHPEGRKYVAIAAAIALASLFIFDFITWPLVFLAFGVAAFFRDPIRVTPQGEGMLIAPADGLVTMIQPVELPPE
ncbi:phosphatidylserine decarboxylase, partial [Enterobacter hormaechei]|uniref:phosphatidylserine decarboxylase n=1 Tax=Enterobacter hormaechei TaxID=158836 RepID=UPI001953E93D